MWYNIDSKVKPSGATNTPGTANLIRRLTCPLYHKGASVLVAKCGNPQPSLSVSQVNPTNYAHGVSPARLPISSDTAIRWLRGCVRIVAPSINAGMARAGIVIPVARLGGMRTWNKASKCASSANGAAWCSHLNHLSISIAHENAKAWRLGVVHCQVKAKRARTRGALLLAFALAAIKSFAASRTQSVGSSSIVRIGATYDAARYHTLRTA